MSKNIELFKSTFKLKDFTFLRGNNLYISTTRCRLKVRKYFFNKRTVNTRNKLPNRIICVLVLTKLKTIQTNSITFLITTNNSLLDLVAAG